MADLEQKYYTSIFAKTDLAGTGKIEGKQAVTLFRTSGVPIQILKQIWSLATPNQEDHLDKNRFFVALKLIALAQEGKPVSIQLLHEKIALPRFEGIDLPVASDEWEIAGNELVVYENGFNKLSGGNGYLTSSESKELLQRTQFAPHVLKKIWTLVGLDNSHNMNLEQFMVAMQLIAKIRTGVEAPEVLPGSLEKLLHKNKSADKPKVANLMEVEVKHVEEKVKHVDVPKLKDPEPHSERPIPVSKMTFGVNYSDSPKLTSRSQNEIEKHIKEQEKALKERTNTLKNICELLEFDLAELDLLKEKNKILEEKVKESETHYKKVQTKVGKAKEKLLKELTDSQNLIKNLKKENEKLQKEGQNVKSQRNSEVSSKEVSLPKANAGFDMDSFFKTPLPSSQSANKGSSDRDISSPFESEVKGAPVPFKEEPKLVNPPEEKKPKVEKPTFNADYFSAESAFPMKSEEKAKKDPVPAMKFEEKPKNDPVPQMKFEEKVINKPGPPMTFDPKPSKFEDDIFAGLDSSHSGAVKVSEAAVKQQIYSSSSSSEENEKKPQAKVEFGFKFSENIEKTSESPSTFDFKPGNMAFPAQFDGFNKGFSFPNANPTFDSDFFKMDTQAIKSKGKPRDLEFD